MAAIPKAIAGNRTATAIGGSSPPFRLIRRGAIIKKAAARPVMATHCLATRESASLFVSSGNVPASGQRFPAVRAIRSATSAATLSLPIEGRPNDNFATFKKNRWPRVTVISFQGTKKSRLNGPKIRMIPMRKRLDTHRALGYLALKPRRSTPIGAITTQTMS